MLVHGRQVVFKAAVQLELTGANQRTGGRMLRALSFAVTVAGLVASLVALLR